MNHDLEYTVFTKKTTQLQDAHVIGHLSCSFDRLVELFKEPLAGDGRESDVMWQIILSNFHAISIYNYKNGKAYMNKDGLEVHNITIWTVGGFFDNDLTLLAEIINGKPALVFEAKLIAKSKENLAQRLRTISEHILEGKTESDNNNEYHSWTLKQNDPMTKIRDNTPRL